MNGWMNALSVNLPHNRARAGMFPGLAWGCVRLRVRGWVAYDSSAAIGASRRA